MIEKEILETFLDKKVIVIRLDNGRQMFSKGRLIKVADSSIVLEFKGTHSAISISSLEHIREIGICPE